MMIEGPFAGLLCLAFFFLGMRVGMWVCDRRWREHAESGFRMDSGHALYEIRKVFDFRPRS